MKLIDVYPDDYPDSRSANKRVLVGPPCHMGGYQQLLRGEPLRGKFRNSWEKPEPLKPGKTTEVDFTMPDFPHVPARPPHHGADAELVVPAVRSESANFRGYSGCQAGGFSEGDGADFPEKDAASGVEVLCCRSPKQAAADHALLAV